MIKKITLCLFAFILINSAMAQQTTGIIGSQVGTPPNAAAFTQYTKVPVGQYTGIANTKIPLYDIKVDKVHIPVYLSYYSKGVQPNVHAGWVGTGWSLVADGVINRKINVLADEYKISSVAAIPSVLGTLVTKENSANVGWYYPEVRGRLKASNWSDINTIAHYRGVGFVAADQISGIVKADTAADTAPDEFTFNINGLSGSFFMGVDGQWKVRSAGGETIRIQETMGSVLVNNQQTVNPGSTTGTTVKTTFTQFILTAGDGTKYVFGGTLPDVKNNSIDFNRTGPGNVQSNANLIAVAWHITEIDLPGGKKIIYDYFRDGNQFTYSPFAGNEISRNIIAGDERSSIMHEIDYNMDIMDPVYLKSITFPDGKLVFNARPSNEVDSLAMNEVPNGILPSIKNTTFNIRNSYPGAYNSSSIFFSYPELYGSNVYNNQNNPKSTWYQLDGVSLMDYNGNKLKNIQLTYSQDAYTRKFLKSVQETDFYNNSAGSTLPPYLLSYNNTPLPPYCTMHTDHWGFYNGPDNVNPYPAYKFDSDNFVTVDFQTAYNQFREPNPDYVKAGILTQIVYPTGGYTQFSYKPNKYSRWVGGKLPITVTLMTQEAIGGGLCVDKVVSTDADNLAPVTYEYSYVNDLTNNFSSGVLGMEKPVYTYIIGNTSFPVYGSNGSPLSSPAIVTYKSWSTNQIPLSQNDDGNIVTYSNVIERQSNNGVYDGIKVSVFSNHDNGYGNNNPDAGIFTSWNEADIYHYSDRSFERGMLLSETSMDNNGNPVKQVKNTYNNDLARFNSFIKGVHSSIKEQRAQTLNISTDGFILGTGSLSFYFVRNSAVRYFTYYPYLQEHVETDYPSDHSANTVTTTTDYSYDQVNGTKNLITTTVKDSRGQVLINKTQYPLDYNLTSTSPQDQFSAGIKRLQDLSAVSLPVENITQLSNADGSNLRTTSASLNSYHASLPFPNLIYRSAISNPNTQFNLSSVSGSGLLNKDATYEPRSYADQFDRVGNLLQEHIAGGKNISYLWGYNQAYPIAQVTGARFDQIAYSSCEEPGLTNDGQANGTNIYFVNNGSALFSADSKTGHNSYNITNSSISTVNPLPAATYIVSYWTKGGGSIVFDGIYTRTNNVDLAADQLGWQYHESTVNVSQAANFKFYPDGSGNSVLIDDIRIYPQYAQMTTYTYDPLVGMTSSTDAKNNVTNYEYDDFQRLKDSKDQYRNIVKKTDYNYKPVYLNQKRSGVFTKQCTLGVGSQVTYTVDEGAYVSNKSVDDANAKADADVAANGQNYANINGACKITTIIFTVQNNTSSPANFLLIMDNKSISGTTLVTANSSAVVTCGITPNSNATIALPVFGQSSGNGTLRSATLSWGGRIIPGVINGSTATFSGVDLSFTQAVSIAFN